MPLYTLLANILYYLIGMERPPNISERSVG